MRNDQSLDQCVLLWSCCRLLRIACQGSSSFRVKHFSAFRIPHSAFRIPYSAPRARLPLEYACFCTPGEPGSVRCLSLSCCRLLRIACQGSSSFRVKHSCIPHSAFRIPHSLFSASRLVFHSNTHASARQASLDQCVCSLPAVVFSASRVRDHPASALSILCIPHSAFRIPYSAPRASSSTRIRMLLHARRAWISASALFLLSSSPHRVSGIIQLPR